MGRIGITAADVVTACVSLNRQQRSIGLRNLRLELGRGSYGTIYKHVRMLSFINYRHGLSSSVESCSGVEEQSNLPQANGTL